MEDENKFLFTIKCDIPKKDFDPLTLVEKIMITRQQQINDKIIEQLHQIGIDKGIETLIAIDEKRLAKFISKIETLELLTKCGIALVVPESECFNNERLTIQLYKKHTTQEQWEKLLELFDIK